MCYARQQKSVTSASEFNGPQNKKVRGHCYYTGLYRGAAHNNCNLKYQIPSYIPIVFHNLRRYNPHLFIKKLGRRFKRKDIRVIAENKEKYISFDVRIKVKLAGVRAEDGTEVCENVQPRLFDSFRFIASSLDKLASNLYSTSGIQSDKCKGSMELMDISSDYIVSLGCERYTTKTRQKT